MGIFFRCVHVKRVDRCPRGFLKNEKAFTKKKVVCICISKINRFSAAVCVNCGIVLHKLSAVYLSNPFSYACHRPYSLAPWQLCPSCLSLDTCVPIPVILSVSGLHATFETEVSITCIRSGAGECLLDINLALRQDLGKSWKV